ncbi:MAG: DUF3298 domain-containing protein [Lachnospiraceae bacterium]|nr:DUF3298 domain-containing protein [Lachnospiraceae bacterium]
MKRKRLFALCLTGSLLLAGCTNGAGGPSRGNYEPEEEPTQAPTPTEAPAEPTEAPTPTEAPPAANDDEFLEFYGWRTGNVYNDPSYGLDVLTVNATHFGMEKGWEHQNLANSIGTLSGIYDECVNGAPFESLKEEVTELNSGQSFPSYYYEEYETAILRGDMTLCSLVVYSDSYYGGAHDVFNYRAHNYDTETGEELLPKDVFTDDALDELPDLLEKSLLEQYDPEIFYDSSKLADTIRTNFESVGEYNFSLGYEEVTFYFNCYELSPYAAGCQIVRFPYDDYPELVKDKYKSNVKEYILPITSQGVYLPGTDEYFNYSADASPDGEEKLDLYMYINDSEARRVVDGYSVKGWLAHVGGENLFLANVRHIDDYETLQVYKIRSNGMDFIQEYPVGLNVSMPLNPHNLALFETCDLLGTYTIYRYYDLSADGSIKEKSQTFDFYSPAEYSIPGFTAKTDLELPSADGKGKIKIEQYNCLYPYETDNESYVDIFLMDIGDVVRLTIDDPMSWPRTSNGVEVDDMFDDLPWSG